MQDLHTILRRKEKDLERVRLEIQALLTVIPLLADPEDRVPGRTVVLPFPAPSSRTGGEVLGNRVADLETCYPFLRGIRRSELK